jgi:hypothetical protein
MRAALARAAAEGWERSANLTSDPLEDIPMNDTKTEQPVFLALKEKAVRFRDKLADELNETPALTLTDMSRLTNFTALQNFIDACDKAIQEGADK